MLDGGEDDVGLCSNCCWAVLLRSLGKTKQENGRVGNPTGLRGSMKDKDGEGIQALTVKPTDSKSSCLEEAPA